MRDFSKAPPACPVCAGSTVSQRMRFGDYVVLRCARCGLQFTDPIPDPETLRQAYNDVYSVDFENYVAGRIGDEKLDRLEALAPERGRLLEIGASYGEWLAAARTRGWAVKGVEISEAAAAHARDVLGLDVTTGDALSAPGGENDYDVVVMWHVLEHTVDPRAVLDHIARLLRPGGVLALHVPNGDSLGSRVGGAWWHWMAPPFHLWYFTPTSIRILLGHAGFGPTDVDVVRGDGQDPLLNLLVAGAGRLTAARRRFRRGATMDESVPAGAFVPGNPAGTRALTMARRATTAISAAADGPMRRFEARGYGDELGVYSRAGKGTPR